LALTKDKKKEVVDKVSDIVKDSQSVVFVNFHGLNMEDTQAMRAELREKGVGYTVAKKTLSHIALENSSVEGDIPELEGELALVYSDEDATAAGREIYEFQKKYEDKVKILGGIFENKFLDMGAMTEIAQIPGMHTLQAQFVNLINSPIQGLAIALSAIAEAKQ